MLKMSALAAGAVLLVSLFLPCAGYAAQEPSQAILPAATGDEILTRLPNGLSVYIIRDKRFPLVCTRLYVRTGSANEDARQAGISHVLEHMVFKGTEQRPKGQVAKDVEARGGYLNAATSFDQTYYLTDMPAAQWRMGMDVVKDMARHAPQQAFRVAADRDAEKYALRPPHHRLQGNHQRRYRAGPARLYRPLVSAAEYAAAGGGGY